MSSPAQPNDFQAFPIELYLQTVLDSSNMYLLDSLTLNMFDKHILLSSNLFYEQSGYSTGGALLITWLKLTKDMKTSITGPLKF